MNLKMTSAQVAETSVNVNNNSSFQNYTNPDDHTRQTSNHFWVQTIYSITITIAITISVLLFLFLFTILFIHFEFIQKKQISEIISINLLQYLGNVSLSRALVHALSPPGLGSVLSCAVVVVQKDRNAALTVVVTSA